jgi:pyruvate,orthophosphate dikinase
VARGWGIPAVVGAAGVHVSNGSVAIGDHVLAVGSTVTIDGDTGEVFEGAVPGSSEVVLEALTLLSWAEELGIAVGQPAVKDASVAAPTASAAVRVSSDRCLRVISLKGLATTESIADAVLSTPDDVRPVLDQLALDGLVAITAGAYRLSEAGTTRAFALLGEERDAWGADQALAALDAFLALDLRTKETVTAWQLRADGSVNDHADADYDASVVDRLVDLHADAVAWLTPLEAQCPRLVDYGVRLDRAVAAAQGGDGRFVASPRVDSYHGIWFELHEDLIQLAGRTREEETAAGRA